MALTKCPDCAAQISTMAVSCPHCGRPMAAPPNSPKMMRPDAQMCFCVKSMVTAHSATVFVDGTKVATVKPGNFKIVAVHPGQHEITVKSPGLLGGTPGKYVINANVNKGETSYFKLSRNKSTRNTTFLGPISMLAFAATSSKSGYFSIEQITERAAKVEFNL